MVLTLELLSNSQKYKINLYSVTGLQPQNDQATILYTVLWKILI